MQARAAKTYIVLWSFVSIVVFVANCDSFSHSRSLALQHQKSSYSQFCTFPNSLLLLELLQIFHFSSMVSVPYESLFCFPDLWQNTIAIGETIIKQGSLCHFCHFCRLAIIRRSERVPFVTLSSTMRCLMTVRSERVQLPFVLLPFDILNVLYLWWSLYSQ